MLDVFINYNFYVYVKNQVLSIIKAILEIINVLRNKKKNKIKMIYKNSAGSFSTEAFIVYS